MNAGREQIQLSLPRPVHALLARLRKPVNKKAQEHAPELLPGAAPPQFPWGAVYPFSNDYAFICLCRSVMSEV